MYKKNATKTATIYFRKFLIFPRFSLFSTYIDHTGKKVI